MMKTTLLVLVVVTLVSGGVNAFVPSIISNRQHTVVADVLGNHAKQISTRSSSRLQAVDAVTSVQLSEAVSALTSDPKIAAAVAAAVAAIVGFVSTSPKGDAVSSKNVVTAKKAAAPKPEPKIDVSIPYDSAARLAFCQTMGISASAEIDEVKFQQYKTLYLEATSAAMAAKQKARELAAQFPGSN